MRYRDLSHRRVGFPPTASIDLSVPEPRFIDPDPDREPMVIDLDLVLGLDEDDSAVLVCASRLVTEIGLTVVGGVDVVTANDPIAPLSIVIIPHATERIELRPDMVLARAILVSAPTAIYLYRDDTLPAGDFETMSEIGALDLD